MSADNNKRVRDPRLDFFRGIGMFIIFIAHVPNDWWALWIPARFGFSDATEIFVFCSGMASAIAFGAVFDQRGMLMGTARIIHRVWQVYWVHIGLFLAVFLFVSVVDLSGITSKSYTAGLNLMHFVKNIQANTIGLFTLTYVPNYFDILPMYLVILAMIPVVMGLSRIAVPWAFAFMGLMWLWANLKVFGMDGIDLPAEPWSSRNWFFNPFGWQLVFFTGFAFMRGWLPQPPVSRNLVIAAAAIVLMSIPFSYFRILNAVPELREISSATWVLRDKTDFGIFRYVHFLALGYLAWVAAGPAGARLSNLGAWQLGVDVIRKVGQQSLAVFAMSMFFARVVGFGLDEVGRNWFTMLAGNLIGFAVIIATAYCVAWFKSQPWRATGAGQPSRAGMAKTAKGNQIPANGVQPAE